MAMSRGTAGLLVPVIVLVLIAWLVELVGLYYLQRSCNARDHVSTWWVAVSGAQLPSTDSCSKVYRYSWWAIWFEFPLVLGIISSLGGWLGSGYNVLQRYRLAWIGLLATCTALQMWSANVMLNLTDTFVSKQENGSEVQRAMVTFYGFAALSALNAVLMFILGDDGNNDSSDFGANEPLVGGA